MAEIESAVMTSDDKLPKLLILAGNRPPGERILNLLRSAFDIDLIGEPGEALDALRRTRYDAVLAAADDFLPLERDLAGQQATTLLDALGEGVCVVSAGGKLLWSNPRMRQAEGSLLTRVVATCTDVAKWLQTRPRQNQAIHRELRHAGSHYEIVCSGVYASEGGLTHLAAVVRDCTAARTVQQKMDAIHTVGRDMVRLGGAGTADMNVEQRMQFIEDGVNRFLHDVLNYDHFALRVLDDKTNRLEVLVSQGMGEQVRQTEVLAGAAGQGITGRVAATGETYNCPDIQADPLYRLLGLTDARSMLAVPLLLQGKVIGVLTLESHHAGAFSEDDRQFAEILANYIAIALNVLDLLTVERFTATTEITDIVASELGSPLNDIKTETVSLMEQYIGDDEMHSRLSRIAETVDGIRRTIRQIAEMPRTGLVPSGAQSEGPDPTILGKHILVADDEDLIRQTIHDVLQRRGAVVDMARDGAEAERMIRAQRYQLVLADIKMPFRSGYDVFAAAKNRDAGTEVILITGFGYDPNHSIVRAHNEDLSAVLFKPFKVDQLLHEVRSALGG